MVNRIFEKMGIKTVNPKQPQMIYTSQGSPSVVQGDFEKRAEAGLKFAESIFKGGSYEDKIAHAKAQAQAVSSALVNPLPKRNTYLNETRQALMHNQDASFIFFDTETLGSLPETRRGTKQYSGSVDFDVGQLSLGVATMDKQGMLQKQGDIVNLTNKINKKTYSQLSHKIAQLENDPNAWVKMNLEEKRSIIDLTIYSDDSFFSVVDTKVNDSLTMRLNVMTGQPDQKMSISASPQVIQENLGLIKQGLENRNNPDFMNETDTVFQFFNEKVTTQNDKKAVLAGHNIQAFDEIGLKSLFAPYIKGTSAETVLSSPSIDTLQLARAIESSNPNYQQRGFQLGQVFDHGSVSEILTTGAHNAGFDVAMNIDAMNTLLKDSKKIALGNGTSIYDSLFSQSPQAINPFESLVATKGFTSYKENAYNQNQNQFSLVMRYDPETDKFVPSRQMQESPIVRGTVYQQLGIIDNYDIDGINHHALILQDNANETINIVFDSNRNRLDEIFSGGQLTPISQVHPEQLEYYQKDRQRRRFASMTDPKVRFKGSVIKNIEQAHKDIDTFETAYQAKMREIGRQLTPSEESDLVDTVFKKINENLSPQFKRSRDKFETNINHRQVLQEERNFAEALIAEAKKTYPAKHQSVQSNLFVSNSMDLYRQEVLTRAKTAGAVKESDLTVGYTGMKMHGIQLSVNGDMNYLDVTNPSTYESSISRLLNNQGMGQSNGQTLQNFDSLTNGVLSQMHSDDKVEMVNVVNELRREVLADIRRDGKISTTTSRNISNRLYGLHESGKLRSTERIPQQSVAARRASAGVFQDAPFMNGLTEKKSEFYSHIFNDAKNQMKGHYIDPKLSSAIELSEDMSRTLQRTQDFVNKMGHYSHASQEIFGFDPGEVKKATASIQQFDVKKAVQDVVSTYEKNNFNTSLMFNEHTNQTELLFSFKGDNIDFKAMTSAELLNNKKVGRQVLPFIQMNGGIDTNAGTVINEMTIKINRGADSPVSVGTSLPEMFKVIQNKSYEMQRNFNEELKFPTGKTSSDIIHAGISSMTADSTRGKSYSAYARGVSPASVNQVFSPIKAFNQSFIASSDSILEDYLQNTKRYDNLYKDWMGYQRNNKGASINNSQDFWNNHKDVHFQSLRLDSLLNYNNTIGKASGQQVDVSGLNATQFSQGLVSLRDARESAPFGLQSSSTREQIIKAPNYASIERSVIDDYWQNEVYGNRYAHLGERGKHVAQRAAGRRTANNQSLHMPYIDENIAHSSSKARGSKLRTLYTTENELANMISEKQPGLVKSIKKEIDELTSRIQSTSDKGTKIQLHKELVELEQRRSKIENINMSVFDGQALVRESVAKNMVINELKTLSIPENQNLPSSILQRIAEQSGVDYVPGQFARLDEGTFNLDKPISYKEMQQMGLINDVGKLLTGEVSSTSLGPDGKMVESQYSSINKRIGDDARIMGITTDRQGRQALLINERRSLQEGDKILGLAGELRNAVKIVDDKSFDALYSSGVDLVAENMAVDKNAYGVALNTIYETSQENIWENLESIDYSKFSPEMAAADLPGLLPGVQAQMRKGNYTVQDMMKESIQEKVFQDSYTPLLEQMGLVTKGDGRHVSYDNQRKIFNFNTIGHVDSLFGEQGQSNYKSLYKTASEQFGFSSKNALVDIGVHDVSHYTGQGTRGNYSFREQDLLEMKSIVEGDIGKPYRNHMKKMHDSQAHLRKPYSELIDSISQMNKDFSSGLGISEIAERPGSGNVIIDLTGSIQSSQDTNFFRSDNGNFHIDGLALGPLPRGTNPDYTGTIMDFQSISILNQGEEIDTTLGAHLRDNPGRVFFKTQTESGGFLETNYMHALPSVEASESAFDPSNLREIKKAERQALTAAYEYNTLYTTQDLSRDEIIDKQNRLSDKFSRGLEAHREQSNRFVTSSQKGSAAKNITKTAAESGGYYNVQTLNQMDYFEETLGGGYKVRTDAPAMNEVMFSKEALLPNIDGKEEAILRMNNYSDKDLSELGIYLDDPAEIKLAYQDEIFRRIEGPAKDDFALYSQMNRQPSQDIHNIEIASVRYDKGMVGDNVALSPVMSKYFKADNDGDKVAANFDLYGGTHSQTDWEAMQEVQQSTRALSNAVNKGLNNMDIDVRNIPDFYTAIAEKASNFTHYDSDITFTQKYVSDFMKESQIGQSSNAIVQMRQSMMAVYGAALETGALDPESVNQSLLNFEDTGSKIVQGMISSKKITPETIGIDLDAVSKLTGQDRVDYLSNAANTFMVGSGDSFKSLMNIMPQEVPTQLEALLANGVIKEVDTDSTRKFLSDVATANLVMQEANIPQGMNNPGLKIGKSKGDPYGQLMQLINNEEYDSILHTSTSDAVMDSISGVNRKELSEAKARQVKNLGSAFENITRRQSTGAQYLSNVQADQFDDLVGLAAQNRRIHNDGLKDSLSGSMSRVLSKAASSDAFMLGAGLSAMWLVGSSLKGGPTPEGDIAQQEATMQQVSPAAFLTSPTARVTPNGENIHLNISGNGNIDQEMAAGLVNQYISGQSGVALNMNMNLSDNTQALDNRFYEDAMSRILGL